MGSERASTTRQRLAGKICAICGIAVKPPFSGSETLCPRCDAGRTTKRRVYMQFMLRGNWHCQFLEEDLKTTLPKKVSFADPAKLFELAERGGYVLNLEGRHAIEQAIRVGRGGIWLRLSAQQYSRLTRG